MDFEDFWHKYSWYNWPSKALQIPTSPNVCCTLPGENRTKLKYALKWTTNVKKLEIGSNKILITAVWAHDVHRLLTYCSTSCYQFQTCHWWHVRVSAVERTSASAHEAIELLEWETSDFISPDLWSPTALTSIRSITSSGGHATADLSDDVQECRWTQEPVEIWIGLEQNVIDTAINKWRKRLRACARAKGQHFEHLL